MLVHRSTVAVEKDTRFLDRYHILFSDAESAWNVLMETLGELQSSADTSEVLVTFSDPDENFRKGLVGGDYKSHRAGSRKPLAYWEIRKRVEDNFATVMAGTSIVLQSTISTQTALLTVLDVRPSARRPVIALGLPSTLLVHG